MLGRIFDVVRIYCAVRFELGPAVFVAPGVIERNAALPKLGSVARRKDGDPIEACHGLRDAAVLEIGDRALEDFARAISWSLAPDNSRYQTELEKQVRSRHRITTHYICASTRRTARFASGSL